MNCNLKCNFQVFALKILEQQLTKYLRFIFELVYIGIGLEQWAILYRFNLFDWLAACEHFFLFRPHTQVRWQRISFAAPSLFIRSSS